MKVKKNNVEFISYTGDYPSLCIGILTLKINNKIYKFGGEKYQRFWESGGDCGFQNDDLDEYVIQDKWRINIDYLPEELKSYAIEIAEVFNENVDYGCCGGCI